MKKLILVIIIAATSVITHANDGDALVEAQLKTLDCVQKILEKRIGGKESVSISLEVMNRLLVTDKLSTDLFEVEDIALFHCTEYLTETGRDRSVTTIEQLATIQTLLDDGEISNKVYNALNKLANSKDLTDVHTDLSL